MERIIGSIYKNNFINRSSDEEFILSLKLCMEAKNKIYKLEKIIFGRTKEIDVFQLTIDERKYIFPITKINATDLLDKHWFNIAAKKGKLIPRGLPNQYNDLFYSAIKNDNEEEYNSLLSFLYIDSEILTVFNRIIKTNTDFKNHLSLIEKSIKNYICGEYETAILCILPTIEGILRVILNNYNLAQAGDYRKNISDKAVKHWCGIFFPKTEYWFPEEMLKNNEIFFYIDELSIVIKSYFDFLEAYLYSDIDKYNQKYPLEKLNRHSILHGFTTNFGTKINYIKIFNILDFLLYVGDQKYLARDGIDFETFLDLFEYKKENEFRKIMLNRQTEKLIFHNEFLKKLKEIIANIDISKALKLYKVNEKNALITAENTIIDELQNKLKIFLESINLGRSYSPSSEDDYSQIKIEYVGRGLTNKKKKIEPYLAIIYFKKNKNVLNIKQEEVIYLFEVDFSLITGEIDIVTSSNLT